MTAIRILLDCVGALFGTVSYFRYRDVVKRLASAEKDLWDAMRQKESDDRTFNELDISYRKDKILLQQYYQDYMKATGAYHEMRYQNETLKRQVKEMNIKE